MEIMHITIRHKKRQIDGFLQTKTALPSTRKSKR